MALPTLADSGPTHSAGQRAKAHQVGTRRWRDEFVVGDATELVAVAPDPSHAPTLTVRTVKAAVVGTLALLVPGGARRGLTRQPPAGRRLGKDFAAQIQARGSRLRLADLLTASADLGCEARLTDVTGSSADPPKHAAALSSTEIAQFVVDA